MNYTLTPTAVAIENIILLCSCAALAYLVAKVIRFINVCITARRERKTKEQNRIRALVKMKQRFIIYNSPDTPDTPDTFEQWIDSKLLGWEQEE